MGKTKQKVIPSDKGGKESEAYKAYKKYIKSKDFDKVRKLVFERDKGCVCCGYNEEDRKSDLEEGKKARSFQCHHRTYIHLYDELEHLDDCVEMCSVCHRAIHRSPSNFKRFKRE